MRNSPRKQYDPSNIFAKILSGSVPCKKVYEDPYVLAFNDVSPKTPVHVLVIPKGAYTCFSDFSAHASSDEITGFFKGVGAVTHLLGVPDDGFRLIANTGKHGGQEVPHFHVHILAGKPLGPLAGAK